jgi:hypothetical protein
MELIVEHVWATFYKNLPSSVDELAAAHLGSVCNVAQNAQADKSFVD